MQNKRKMNKFNKERVLHYLKKSELNGESIETLFTPLFPVNTRGEDIDYYEY